MPFKVLIDSKVAALPAPLVRNLLYSLPAEASAVAESILSQGGLTDSDITITVDSGDSTGEPNTVNDGRQFLLLAWSKQMIIVNSAGRLQLVSISFQQNAGELLAQLQSFPSNPWVEAVGVDGTGQIERIN